MKTPILSQIAELRNATEKRLGEQDLRLSAVEQRIDFFVNAVQTPTGGIPASGMRFDEFVLNFVTPEEVEQNTKGK